MKLNFGCGGNRLEGWINMDAEVPIEKPLPFPDSSADFILAEHVVEHVTPQQAWNFFEECRRVLKVGGVLRVCVPDVEKIWLSRNAAYGEAVKAGGHGDGSNKGNVRAAIFDHGHQGAWTQSLLGIIMEAVGFFVEYECYGQSHHDSLHGIDGHGTAVGREVAQVETSVVEGTKT